MSYAGTANLAGTELYLSIKKIIKGTFAGAPTKVTKSGFKTMRMAMADIRKTKLHKNASKLDSVLNGSPKLNLKEVKDSLKNIGKKTKNYVRDLSKTPSRIGKDLVNVAKKVR